MLRCPETSTQRVANRKLHCRYEVVKKKAKFDDAMGEMVERICRQFCNHGRPQCGIVYCLSRNDCEKVAAELQKRLAARLGNRTCVRCSIWRLAIRRMCSAHRTLAERRWPLSFSTRLQDHSP